MSYDLVFDCGPLQERHGITGGTFAFGWTNEPWLNITYNYAPFFYAIWPENGIRSLYGKTAAEIIKELDAEIPKMSGERSEDYWEATEGNAKAALKSLRDLASLCPPEAILSGD